MERDSVIGREGGSQRGCGWAVKRRTLFVWIRTGGLCDAGLWGVDYGGLNCRAFHVLLCFRGVAWPSEI